MKQKRGKTTHKTSKRAVKTTSHRKSSKRAVSAKHAMPGSAAKKRAKAKRKRHAAKTKKHPSAGRKKLPKALPPPKLLEEKIMPPPHELEEEFFVPSPIHRGKYLIPLGIRFLIGYLSFLAVLYMISFVSGITFPTTILFGKMITGTRALIINSVLLLLIFAMIFGLWKRKAYSFDLCISFFSFSALNAMISLLLFESAEHPIFRKLLLLSFVSLIIMNIIIVWYILHEKKYFYSERFKDRPFHHRDKVFLYFIVTFWTVTLLLGITLGAQFYKDTTEVIDQTIAEMEGDYYHGQLVCEQKKAHEKDICYLVVATALSAQYDSAKAGSTTQAPKPDYFGSLCDDIDSEFYRFTCIRSITGQSVREVEG
jgi:hypothetical protein